MERNKRIDQLKAYAIILVLVGHAIQQTTNDFLENSYVAIGIYSFHMPLFFFISGYLMMGHNVDFGWLYKQFVRLVIPIVTWQYLVFIWNDHEAHNLDLISPLKQWLSNPGGYFWFLWVLFLCHTLLFLIKKIGNGKSPVEIGFDLIIVLILLVVTHICSVTWGNIHTLYYYLIFYFGGYWYSYYFKENSMSYCRKPKRCIIYGMIWFCLLSFYINTKQVDLGIVTNCINLFLRFAMACSGIFFSWYLIGFPSGEIGDCLSIIGKYTKEIYIIHTIVMPYIVLSGGLNISSILFKVVVSLAVSLVVAIVVNNDYLKILLLGKI